jgi:protein-tyrosine kinase
LLPSGPIPPNPTEILNSEAFAALLQAASEQFDHVIVDSPPLLPVADARILASKCSATVLVVSIGKTTRGNGIGAASALAQSNATVLGVAINNTSKAKGYGYSGGARNGNGEPVTALPRRIATPQSKREAAPEDGA